MNAYAFTIKSIINTNSILNTTVLLINPPQKTGDLTHIVGTYRGFTSPSPYCGTDLRTKPDATKTQEEETIFPFYCAEYPEEQKIWGHSGLSCAGAHFLPAMLPIETTKNCLECRPCACISTNWTPNNEHNERNFIVCSNTAKCVQWTLDCFEREWKRVSLTWL